MPHSRRPLCMCPQTAARGRPVKVLRTVAILRHTDVHQLDEFSGWDIPTEQGLAVTADMVAVVRALNSSACFVVQCADAISGVCHVHLIFLFALHALCIEAHVYKVMPLLCQAAASVPQHCHWCGCCLRSFNQSGMIAGRHPPHWRPQATAASSYQHGSHSRRRRFSDQQHDRTQHQARSHAQRL